MQDGMALLPGGYRRLAGAAIAVCTAVTAVLALRYAHQSRAGAFDRAVGARTAAHLARFDAVLALLAKLGNAKPMLVLTVALVLACLALRRPRAALLAGAAVPAAVGLTEFVLKPLVDRTKATSLAFPSGHSTGTFALAAVFAVLLANPAPLRLPRLPAWCRALAALAALAVAAGVATALVGLNKHYATDTVGGACVAVAVVLATALLLDRFAPAG